MRLIQTTIIVLLVASSQLCEAKESFGTMTGSLTSIDDALSKFHNNFCDEKKMSRTKLADRWHIFIEALSDPGSKQLAARAMAVDIVSRTSMYEANSPGTSKLTAKHPNQVDCEQDIIALSLRNRIATCKKKSYGCNFEKDLVGAAMTPAMYNIWDSSYIKKTDITGCFLKDSLQVNGKDKAFNLYRDEFKKVTKRVQKILGYDQTAEARESGEYLTQLFDAEQLDEKPLSSEKKLHYLKEMLHYYHRGGLGKCNAAKREIDDLSLVTITQDLPPGKVRFPYKGEVLLKGGVIGSNNPIFKTVGKDGPSKYDFYMESSELEKLKNPSQKKGYDCLPEGFPPECAHVFQGNSYLQQQGKLVPQWTHKDEDAKLVDDMDFTRDPNKNAYGKYLKVRCKNPEFEKNGNFPSFGGKCTETMRMFSEVDREAPEPPEDTERVQ